MVHVGLADDHARQKRPQREGNAEQLIGQISRAQGQGDNGNDEQLARTQISDLGQHPGHQPRSGKQHDDGKQRGLQQGHADADNRVAGLLHQNRHEHQYGNRGQVLEDKPTDGHPPVRCGHQSVIGQAAQQHDRAGNRDRQTQYETGFERPAPKEADAHTGQRRQGRLGYCSRNGNLPHIPEVAQREMKSDAKHHEDDAHFRQLRSRVNVAHETRRKRADHQSGGDVADQRGQPGFPGQEPADQREQHCHGDGGK